MDAVVCHGKKDIRIESREDAALASNEVRVRVLVAGSGPIGILTMAALKFAGASEIVVTDLTDAALAVAADRIGADRTINVAEDAVGLNVYAEHGGYFDLAVEASGAASALRSFVMHNAPLEHLASGFRWLEGPVWFGDAGALIFSDIPNNRLMRWSESEGISIYRAGSDFANGNTRDREGRLVSCSHGARAILRTELDGHITTLADRYQGKRLNSPNDVVVKSDGTIWFSDPHYGIGTDYEGYQAEQELPCQVYRLDPEAGELTVVAADFDGPNGLAFSPDERSLYIAETGAMFDPAATPHMRAFDVADDNTLSGGRHFHTVDPGVSDGFRCDEDGNIWTSAADGVHCIAPDGRLLGKVRVPETVANVAFGGRACNRLFICASTSLYAVYLNRRGISQQILAVP
jgi:gluconolactonase